MNLPNKLTIFRIILVPIMAIIPFFNFDIKWIVIDIIFILHGKTRKNKYKKKIRDIFI